MKIVNVNDAERIRRHIEAHPVIQNCVFLDYSMLGQPELLWVFANECFQGWIKQEPDDSELFNWMAASMRTPTFTKMRSGFFRIDDHDELDSVLNLMENWK